MIFPYSSSKDKELMHGSSFRMYSSGILKGLCTKPVFRQREECYSQIYLLLKSALNLQSVFASQIVTVYPADIGNKCWLDSLKIAR